MRHLLSVLAALLLAAPAFAAGVIAEPMSYTKPVPGGRFVFVMLGDPAAEAKTDAATQAKFRELREKYPRTGLYREGSAELVWALDGPFAAYDNVFPAEDGVHLVRVEGDWWQEKDFTGGRARLPAEEEQRQLDAPAVSFFAGGKPVRRYAVRELIADTAALPQTPRFVLWYADGNLDERTGRFVMFTQDSQRLAFDYKSGGLLARSKSGLGNPLMPVILLVSGALSLCILGAWAYFAFFRGRRAAETARPT